MYELSNSALRCIAGGINELSAATGALTATVGYVATRSLQSDICVPTSVIGPSTTGGTISVIGCGSAAHLVGSSSRFSAQTNTIVSMATGFLCGAAMGIGEIIYDEIVCPPCFLDDDWPFV